jgi:3-oxoacyl-[acyl-carrier-protein] synthase-3
MNHRIEADIARANELLASPPRLPLIAPCPACPHGQRSTVILGTGSYAPEAHPHQRRTSPRWWTPRTSGSHPQRHPRAPDRRGRRGHVRPGRPAARAALADAKLTASDIDLLVVATVTPDMTDAAAACIIQHKLGIPTNAACFDLNAACSGFIYALDTACAMLASGRYRRALVIGAEKLSSIVDWKDRTTCVLFGDGAGAVVIGVSHEPGIGLLGTRLGALWRGAPTCSACPAGGSNTPPPPSPSPPATISSR